MFKNILLFSIGSLLLITGITLVLREWNAVVVVFKGVIGMGLALAGMVVLMLVKVK